MAQFALVHIAEGQGWAGIVEHDESLLIDDALSYNLDSLRCNCVALVDAFDYPDNVLGTALGRFDGNVYEVSASIRSTVVRA